MILMERSVFKIFSMFDIIYYMKPETYCLAQLNAYIILTMTVQIFEKLWFVQHLSERKLFILRLCHKQKILGKNLY